MSLRFNPVPWPVYPGSSSLANAPDTNPAAGIKNSGLSKASPTVVANSDRVLVVWSDEYDESGASNDQDVVYSISTNDGSTWSGLAAIS